MDLRIKHCPSLGGSCNHCDFYKKQLLEKDRTITELQGRLKLIQDICGVRSAVEPGEQHLRNMMFHVPFAQGFSALPTTPLSKLSVAERVSSDSASNEDFPTAAGSQVRSEPEPGSSKGDVSFIKVQQIIDKVVERAPGRNAARDMREAESNGCLKNLLLKLDSELKSVERDRDGDRDGKIRTLSFHGGIKESIKFKEDYLSSAESSEYETGSSGSGSGGSGGSSPESESILNAAVLPDVGSKATVKAKAKGPKVDVTSVQLQWYANNNRKRTHSDVNLSASGSESGVKDGGKFSPDKGLRTGNQPSKGQTSEYGGCWSAPIGDSGKKFFMKNILNTRNPVAGSLLRKLPDETQISVINNK